MAEAEKDISMAVRIAKAVAACGGTAYYVGGFVRDRLMGKSGKDVDIEVHGITPRQLEEILDTLGERISIGESFGVYNIKGYDVDIAMPRKETMRGSGHRDFDIFVDPFVGTEKAAMRRDFTINALMENVLTGEIIDHFGGREDLENKILRHVNEKTFPEDALRVLRGAQFAARFDFAVAPQTVALCRRMTLAHLPQERVMGELSKAMLKSDKPSVFFETLRQMEQLDIWFPEVQALIGVPQNQKFHAEGDVWVHTMRVLDMAVRFRHTAQNPLAFMLSALAHDFGKAVCTEAINGVLHAYSHEIEGLPIAKQFVTRLTNEKEIADYVLNMVEHHMRPNTMAVAGSSIKATNKMYDRSVDPVGLIGIATADGLGSVTENGYVSYEAFQWERLDIYREYMARPYVMGRDLIEAGLRPGAQFGEYLEYAHKLRLAGVPKANALTQTLAYARKKEKKHDNGQK